MLVSDNNVTVSSSLFFSLVRSTAKSALVPSHLDVNSLHVPLLRVHNNRGTVHCMYRFALFAATSSVRSQLNVSYSTLMIDDNDFEVVLQDRLVLTSSSQLRAVQLAEVQTTLFQLRGRLVKFSSALTVVNNVLRVVGDSSSSSSNADNLRKQTTVSVLCAGCSPVDSARLPQQHGGRLMLCTANGLPEWRGCRWTFTNNTVGSVVPEHKSTLIHVGSSHVSVGSASITFQENQLQKMLLPQQSSSSSSSIVPPSDRKSVAAVVPWGGATERYAILSIGSQPCNHVVYFDNASGLLQSTTRRSSGSSSSASSSSSSSSSSVVKVQNVLLSSMRQQFPRTSGITTGSFDGCDSVTVSMSESFTPTQTMKESSSVSRSRSKRPTASSSMSEQTLTLEETSTRTNVSRSASLVRSRNTSSLDETGTVSGEGSLTMETVSPSETATAPTTEKASASHSRLASRTAAADTDTRTARSASATDSEPVPPLILGLDPTLVASLMTSSGAASAVASIVAMPTASAAVARGMNALSLMNCASRNANGEPFLKQQLSFPFTLFPSSVTVGEQPGAYYRAALWSFVLLAAASLVVGLVWTRVTRKNHRHTSAAAAAAAVPQHHHSSPYWPVWLKIPQSTVVFVAPFVGFWAVAAGAMSQAPTSSADHVLAILPLVLLLAMWLLCARAVYTGITQSSGVVVSAEILGGDHDHDCDSKEHTQRNKRVPKDRHSSHRHRYSDSSSGDDDDDDSVSTSSSSSSSDDSDDDHHHDDSETQSHHRQRRLIIAKALGVAAEGGEAGEKKEHLPRFHVVPSFVVSTATARSAWNICITRFLKSNLGSALLVGKYCWFRRDTDDSGNIDLVESMPRWFTTLHGPTQRISVFAEGGIIDRENRKIWVMPFYNVVSVFASVLVLILQGVSSGSNNPVVWCHSVLYFSAIANLGMFLFTLYLLLPNGLLFIVPLRTFVVVLIEACALVASVIAVLLLHVDVHSSSSYASTLVTVAQLVATAGPIAGSGLVLLVICLKPVLLKLGSCIIVPAPLYWKQFDKATNDEEEQRDNVFDDDGDLELALLGGGGGGDGDCHDDGGNNKNNANDNGFCATATVNVPSAPAFSSPGDPKKVRRIVTTKRIVRTCKKKKTKKNQQRVPEEEEQDEEAPTPMYYDDDDDDDELLLHHVDDDDDDDGDLPPVSKYQHLI